MGKRKQRQRGGAAGAAAASTPNSAAVAATDPPREEQLRRHWTSSPLITAVSELAPKAMSDPTVLAESASILRRRPSTALGDSSGASAGGGAGVAHSPAVILSADPLIYTIDDFFTAGVAWLPDPTDGRVDSGSVGTNTCTHNADQQHGGSSGPTDGLDGLAEEDVDELVVELECRLCRLLGCRPECTEPFQVIHYEVGQEYTDHCDGYDATTEHGAQNCARGGNRIVTSLVYLSDVAGGGQTTFSNLDLTVEPQQGRVLVFHNCTADSPSKVDSRTLHAGMPVEAGEKWACNKWVRQFPLRSAGRYNYVLS